MKWIRVKTACFTEDIEIVSAVMSMIDGNLHIEDYSDVAQGINAVYGELLDEELIKKNDGRATVSFYLSEEKNAETATLFVNERLFSLGVDAEVNCFPVDEEDWAHAWKKYYKAIKIGKNITVVPAWEYDGYKARDGEITIKMDPGMAFGTGTHETTQLCAALIEEYINPGAKVLDIGTGSGILAIMAAKLGCRQADAVDIDYVAVETAKRNCIENGAGAVNCFQSDLLENVRGKYDAVFANIVADIVLRIVSELENFLNEGAIVIVSGIIETQSKDVEKAFIDSGFKLEKINSENDWNAMAFKFK